jgi:mannose-6-phosphate isomerase-like protein (cupin superfamily)
VRASSLRLLSPLATWFPDRGAIRRFRAAWLGRAAVVLPARDEAWRTVAPGYRDAVAMAASGLPFQIAAGRKYDRAADPRRLRPALARGATVFLPQVHQVLPRLTRLMVALRATLLGPFREECSFLFIAEGRGREGMGLHHDGEADQFWLQLEGRRTVTLGRPVPAGVPADLPARALSRGQWRTIRLPPGALFYMPPRTPHRVVCDERSLAVTMTWRRSTGAGSRQGAADAAPGRGVIRTRALGLTAWDVVSGYAEPIPPVCPGRLWTQVPVCPVRTPAGRREVLVMAGQGELRLPSGTRQLAAALTTMPALAVTGSPPDGVRILIEQGVLAARDLPLTVIPADPAALDGWRFA